jgi:hypothetical protein
VAGLIAPGEKFGAEALRTAAAAALSANVHSHAYVREWLASGRTILTSEPASSGAGYHLMDVPASGRHKDCPSCFIAYEQYMGNKWQRVENGIPGRADRLRYAA